MPTNKNSGMLKAPYAGTNLGACNDRFYGTLFMYIFALCLIKLKERVLVLVDSWCVFGYVRSSVMCAVVI
jgi:hypothetical protein